MKGLWGPGVAGCILSVALSSIASAQTAQANRSAIGCTEEVSVSAGEYWTRSRIVEARAGGVRFSGCQRDAAPARRLERDASCAPLVALQDRQMRERTRLYIAGADGTRRLVAECAARPSDRVIPLEPTTAGCGFLHDADRGRSLHLVRWVARLGNRQVEVAGCGVEGAAFSTHRRLECQPLLAPRLVQQVRIEIDTEKGPVMLLGCQPDLRRHPEIRQTEEGCEQGQRYIVDGAGGRQVLTECLPDLPSGPRVAARRVGYEFDDTREIAWPLFDNGQGRRRAELPVPYRFVASESRQSGRAERLGCSEFRERVQTRILRRPDGSMLRKTNGRDGFDEVDLCSGLEAKGAKP